MEPSFHTEFTKSFNLRYPIVCAPMFLVSNEEMVVAAANAGIVGAFPALNFRPVENYRQALRRMRSRTKGAIAVNIIVQSSNKFAREHLDIALEEGADLIITSLGNPKDVIVQAHQTRAKVYCDVIGLSYAKKVKDLGADGLVAVGSGAGGHAGETSLLALVPYLKKNTGLPVLAAGCISSGETMAAALCLGADGVYIGTRFIASQESPASPEYKQAILKAGPEDIVNTDKVDGFPGNFILTPSLKSLGTEPGFFETLARQSKRLKRTITMIRAARALFGSTEGKASYKTIFSAGHGVGLIEEIAPIDVLVQGLVRDCRATLRSRL